MNKKLTFKLISSTIGIALGLVLAEVGYRVFHFINHRDLSAIAVGNLPPVVSPNEEKTLGQVIQLSANRRIVYELIPSSNYRFQKVAVRISTQGFRDVEYPVVKPKRCIRIIGLGDSVMFGWGVQEAESYLSLVEDTLSLQDSIDFEVVNTAVPGYNTVMEVETFKEKFDANDVDVVVLNFVGNDLDLPNFIRKLPDYLGIKKSFLLQRLEDNDGIDRHLRSAPFDQENRSYEKDLEKIPAEYRDMVGKQAFVGAMTRLKDLQAVHDFRVIVLSTDHKAEAPPFVKEACQRLGFELLEIQPFWNQYLAHHPAAIWEIASNDGHPSVLGHAVIAAALQEKIRLLL